MADKLHPQEAVTVREMLLSQMFEMGALLDLLERKGVLTKQEFLDEVRVLQRKAAKGSAPDIDDRLQCAGWMGAVENQRDHP